MIRLLLNPFEKYQEKTLFIFGILIAVAGSAAAYLSSGRYDGAIDFHLAENVQWQEPFTDNAINIFSLSLFVFIAARVVNTKTRIIDILNVVLIARIPLYLLTLSNIGGFMTRITKNIDPAHPEKIMADVPGLIILLVFAAISIALLVWFIALLYNGFKTACNARQAIHNLYFALAIIAAEVLSKFLIYTIS